MRFEHIDTVQYQQLINETTVLKHRSGIPTIMLTKDGRIVKHMYKRKFWSSSHLWPYAVRFQRNAQRLHTLGIKVPKVHTILYYPDKKCHLLIYEFLRGSNLRDLAEGGDMTPIRSLPSYLADLHRLGIYFYDLRTDNIILQPDNKFALVDLETIKLKKKPLSAKTRARNIAHMYKVGYDTEILSNYGLDIFIEEYLEASQLVPHKKARFLDTFFNLTKGAKGEARIS